MSNEEKILSLLLDMQKNLSDLKDDVSDLKKDMAVMKEDVSGLTQDVVVLKEDVSGLKQDVAVLKEDVDGVKGQQQENMSILGALEHRSEENSAKLEGLSVAMNKEFGLLRSEIKEAVSDIPPMKQMIMEHEFLFRKMRVK